MNTRRNGSGDGALTAAETIEVKATARRYVKAMTQLSADMDKVAVAAAKLTELLTRGIPGPPENIPLYSKVDAAMGKLGDAYRDIAAAFDNLPE